MSRKKQPTADDFDETIAADESGDFTDDAGSDEAAYAPAPAPKKKSGDMKLIAGVMIVAVVGYYLYTTMFASPAQEGMAPPVPLAATAPQDASASGQPSPSSEPSSEPVSETAEGEAGSSPEDVRQLPQLALPPVVATPETGEMSAIELPPRPVITDQPASSVDAAPLAIPADDEHVPNSSADGGTDDAAADPFATSVQPPAASADVSGNVSLDSFENTPPVAPSDAMADDSFKEPPLAPAGNGLPADGNIPPAGDMSAQNQVPSDNAAALSGTPSGADQQRIAELEQTVRDLQSRLDTLAAKNEIAEMEAARKVEAPVVKKKSAAPKKAAPRKSWIMKSARPGSAWLVDGSGGQLRQVYVGDTVEGIGDVTAVEKNEAGRWVVRGTKSSVVQK